jgi:hypothetical protein
MSREIIDREYVGRLMHESWSRTKRAQGFHGPNDMDNCADKNYVAEETFFCQCGKLHPDLIPWDDLPEKQKDINRHAFDDVLPYFERLLAQEQERVREMCAVAVERTKSGDDFWNYALVKAYTTIRQLDLTAPHDKEGK